MVNRAGARRASGILAGTTEGPGDAGIANRPAEETGGRHRWRPSEPRHAARTETAPEEQESNRKASRSLMSLLAGLQVLLWRYSGQKDVAVGTVTAGIRNQGEIENVIGKDL